MKDRRDNSFLISYFLSANLDGFILSICPQTSPLGTPLCSSVFPTFTLSFALEIFVYVSPTHPHTLSHTHTHCPPLIKTLIAPLPSPHNDISFLLPIFCLLLSFSLNFLLHYSFLTFDVALRDEYPFNASVCVRMSVCVCVTTYVPLCIYIRPVQA